MTAEELEELAARFGKCAGEVIKENAPFENVSSVAVSALTSTMLLAYVLMRRGLHNSAQENTGGDE